MRHGMYGTQTYNSWAGMIQRCTNENHISHEDYIGVTVCDAWLDDFINFFNDMGVRPEGYSLDRIDPNGNYEPSNCRWADAHTQTINRSSTRWLEFKGEKLCLNDWAKRVGIERRTISARLRLGWSIEKALTVHAVKGNNQHGRFTTGKSRTVSRKRKQFNNLHNI